MKCIHFMRLKEKFSNFFMNIMLLTKMCQEAINFRSLINYFPIDIIFQHILLILNISYDIFSAYLPLYSPFSTFCLPILPIPALKLLSVLFLPTLRILVCVAQLVMGLGHGISRSGITQLKKICSHSSCSYQMSIASKLGEGLYVHILHSVIDFCK